MDVPIMSGDEHFTYGSSEIAETVKDFWAWNSSNLLSNTLRGALAEFIVAKALGISFSCARNDWTEYDLLYSRCRVEVKSSAYLQAWEQCKLSEIRFGIAPSRAWTSSQCYDDNKIRHSDVYVFCLYGCQERQAANPLCLDDWKFYVLPTKRLDKLGPQKTISLKGLLDLSPICADYISLKEAVDSIYET